MRTRAASALLAATLAITPANLWAHPHGEVEQQAHLSLGRSTAIVSFRIVPSANDGAHMFEHLDRDNDGILTGIEKRTFAEELFANSRLIVDGTQTQMRLTNLVFPSREEISSGNGMIEVTGSAQLELSTTSAHTISLDVRYDEFSEDWFLQPFYFSELASLRPLPVLGRSASGGINIRIEAM